MKNYTLDDIGGATWHTSEDLQWLRARALEIYSEHDPVIEDDEDGQFAVFDRDGDLLGSCTLSKYDQ